MKYWPFCLLLFKTCDDNVRNTVIEVRFRWGCPGNYPGPGGFILNDVMM